MGERTFPFSLRAIFFVTVLAVVPACSWPLRPGVVEGAAPPRMITIDGNAGWDNPAAFGAVPPELQATGDEVCAAMNTRWRTYRATGYHSRAQMPDGTTFDRGGYYCE